MLADTDNADSVSAIVSIKSMIFRSYSDWKKAVGRLWRTWSPQGHPVEVRNPPPAPQ